MWLLPHILCTDSPILVCFKDQDGDSEVEKVLFSQDDAKTIVVPDYSENNRWLERLRAA